MGSTFCTCIAGQLGTQTPISDVSSLRREGVTSLYQVQSFPPAHCGTPAQRNCSVLNHRFSQSDQAVITSGTCASTEQLVTPWQSITANAHPVFVRWPRALVCDLSSTCALCAEHLQVHRPAKRLRAEAFRSYTQQAAKAAQLTSCRPSILAALNVAQHRRSQFSE